VKYLFLFVFAVCLCLEHSAQPNKATPGVAGYNIRINLKPEYFKKLYLGRYFGDELIPVDSAYLDFKSEFVFRGHTYLPDGLYYVSGAGSRRLFDVVINKEQRFLISADMTTVRPVIRFDGSQENTLLRQYLDFTRVKGDEYAAAEDALRLATSHQDSMRSFNILSQIDKEGSNFQEKIIGENNGTMVSLVIRLLQEPGLPDALVIKKNKKDSTAAKQYLKDHYWDGINFYDGRLAHTPFFTKRLDRYFDEVLDHNEDSVIRKIDWMMQFATASEPMTHLLLKRLVFGSMNHRYKWGDEVLVHLFQTYIAPRSYSWLPPADRKRISERVYMMMGNLVGTPSPNIELPSPDGKIQSLRVLKSAYTILCFWDPTCSHCRETLPKLDSLYTKKWKAAGVRIFAIASESEGTKDDWLKYILENRLSEWTNVYCSGESEIKQVQSGQKSYAQQFDVWYSPTFFLLDRNKNFVARKLPFKNLAELVSTLVK
jgi:thiol-disulfide isomerase/thioredoxin